VIQSGADRGALRVSNILFRHLLKYTIPNHEWRAATSGISRHMSLFLNGAGKFKVYGEIPGIFFDRERVRFYLVVRQSDIIVWQF